MCCFLLQTMPSCSRCYKYATTWGTPSGTSCGLVDQGANHCVWATSSLLGFMLPRTTHTYQSLNDLLTIYNGFQMQYATIIVRGDRPCYCKFGNADLRRFVRNVSALLLLRCSSRLTPWNSAFSCSTDSCCFRSLSFCSCKWIRACIPLMFWTSAYLPEPCCLSVTSRQSSIVCTLMLYVSCRYG